MDYSNEKLETIRAFPKGYGEFPYIIVHLYSACYMQIPLQINTGYNEDLYPGSQINGIAESLLEDYRKNKTSKLHEILINRTKIIRETLQEQHNRPLNLCLVEGREIAHYFESDKIVFFTFIPFGGALVNHFRKIIAMNVKHYIE